jgi:hypothetical protein
LSRILVTWQVTNGFRIRWSSLLEKFHQAELQIIITHSDYFNYKSQNKVFNIILLECCLPLESTLVLVCLYMRCRMNIFIIVTQTRMHSLLLL